MNSQVEFKDVRVTSGSSVLYSSDFANGASEWRTMGGTWMAEDGVYKQTAPDARTRAGIGSTDWRDYAVTLKVRKTGGECRGHKPEAVMLMIGTNNTGSCSGPEIAEGIGAIVLELRKDFPDAKILLLAILPRGACPADANRRKIEETNRIIARLDDQKHVLFMNINSRFLDDKGGLIGFRSDNLHPVEQGYEIWASAVAPTLKSWVE